MKNIFTFWSILFATIFFAQSEGYSAQFVDEDGSPLSYVRLRYKNALFNTDEEGKMIGGMTLGDTITTVDYEYETMFHIIEKSIEKIILKRKFNRTIGA